jgi:hypothetical protein
METGHRLPQPHSVCASLRACRRRETSGVVGTCIEERPLPCCAAVVIQRAETGREPLVERSSDALHCGRQTGHLARKLVSNRHAHASVPREKPKKRARQHSRLRWPGPYRDCERRDQALHDARASVEDIRRVDEYHR